MSQKNREKQKRLRAEAGKNATPVKSTRQAGGNRRAQAVLRKLQRQMKQNKEVANNPKYPKVTSRTIGAGGISSTDNAVPKSGSEGRAHDLEFTRTNADPDGNYSYEPRRNVSKENAQLRRANIKFQQGALMDAVPVGDDVVAQPVESDSGRNPRARMYDRATRGALKPTTTHYGSDNQYSMQEVKATRMPGNNWRNPANAGDVNFDPKSLQSDLKGMAARKAAAFLGGPIVQGAMAVDGAVAGLTGQRPSEHIAAGTLDTFRRAVRDYSAKGANFNPGSIMPY